MTHDPSITKADIFSQHHRYSGMVMTRGYRLADMLNNPATEVLEIQDVRVSQPTNSKSSEVECKHIMLKKDAILLAIPVSGYEAPSRRVYSFVEKQHYLAQVVVPGYTLAGTLHLPSRANSWTLLSHGTTEASFVAITDVTLRFAAPEVEPLRSKVVIFRRQAIESLYLSERPLGQQSLAQTARELQDPDALELAKELIETEKMLEPDQAEELATIPLVEPVALPEPSRRA